MSTGRNAKHEWETAFDKSGLRGAPYVVGSWIGHHWNGDRKHPLAPVEMIARETGYSVRSVKGALKRLRDEGWIAQITRGGQRGEVGWASRYRLTVPTCNPLQPKVQSSATQRAIPDTPVDQTCRPDCVDQTASPEPPPVGQGGASEPRVREPRSVAEERNRRKWVSCPRFSTTSRTCPDCEVNDPCIESMNRHLQTLNGATDE